MNLSRCSRAVLTLAADGLLTVAMVILASWSTFAAGPWYVAPNGDDGDDCLSPTTPCATINGAIARSSSGDTIYVATGTYTGTGSAVVLLNKDVTLSGGWEWDGTLIIQSGASVIDGEGSRRGIVTSSDVIASVERFVVRSGSSPNGGGGIFNDGVLTLDDIVISHSTASVGGGVFNFGGSVTFNNSAVTNNAASDSGGGIGGNGTVTLNNSTVSGNTATDGGGIYVWHNGLVAVNLNNSTITNNTANQGGGIHSGDNSPTVTVILRNTILAGNKASTDNSLDCAGPIGSWGHNLVGNTSGCDFVRAIGDLTDVTAHLGPLIGSPGYHPLLSGSPAIDAGNPAGCAGSTGPLITDQRGFARFGRCDIGAYEAQSFKTATRSTVLPGEHLTFTIAVQNGDVITTTFRVTDTLPLSLTYAENSLTASSGSYGYRSGMITWTGSITAGEVVQIRLTTIVSQMVPLGISIINSAVVIGGSEIITRTATIDVEGRVCNLTKHADNPVLSVGVDDTWDEDDVWDPVVLKGESVYMMWYTGDAGSTPSQIGLATSTDSIEWIKSSHNPVLSPAEAWETGGVRVASVVFDKGVFKMWYTGLDSAGIGRIGYAISADGITWTKHSSNPVLDIGVPGSWEGKEIAEPSVIQRKGTYHMWYEGYDGVAARIGHATSDDGINWTRDPANPVLDTGLPGDWDWLHVHSPSIVTYGGTYLLWYSGGTLPPTSRSGYALSSNGHEWLQREKLISEGIPGTFDASGADYPSAIVDGDGFKVWYTGIDDTGTYNIGSATAGICDTTAPLVGAHIYLPVVMKGWRKGCTCSPYYSDDFSDPGSGWPVYYDDHVGVAYTDGQYQIWLKKPSLGWLVTPGARAADFMVAVSACRITGTYGVYGIIFGLNEDWSELYQLHIEAHYYSLWRRKAETWAALQYWTVSDHINAGTSWNRLKVVRDGASMAVYVNDQHLTTVIDDSFTGLRRIGLVAYSPGDGSLDVRFDDFSLYPASCGTSTVRAGYEMGMPEIHLAPMQPGKSRPP